MEQTQRFKLYKDGKHLVTATFFGLLVAFGIASATITHSASADDLPNEGQVSIAGKDGYISFSDGASEPVVNLRMSDEVVFCINPFVIVHDGALASAEGQNTAVSSLWDQMSLYQQTLANNVAWVGQSQGAKSDPSTYFATQLAMWSVLAGQNGVPGAVNGSGRIDTSQLRNVLNGRTVTGYQSQIGGDVAAKAAQILENAGALSQTPTFNPAPLNIVAGKEGSIDATNGVDLTKYKRITSNKAGVSAHAEGNRIVVDVAPGANAGDFTLTLDTGRDDKKINYIYGTVNPDGNAGQTLYGAGDPSRQTAQINANIVKANLKIDKNVLQDNGETNKHLSNSNYSLDGNVFEIHKDSIDGPVVKELTTDANGYAETGEVMDYGQYFITEKQASKGLYNSFTPIQVTLDADGQRIQSVSATNKEVRGGSTLTKTDSKTGSDTEGKATFKGTQYGLFNEDGTAVKWQNNGQPDPIITAGTKANDTDVVLTVDDKAQVGVKNLALGNYYWKELKEPEGYAIDPTKRQFSLTYAGDKTAELTADASSL